MQDFSNTGSTAEIDSRETVTGNVGELVAAMTLKEKVGLMTGSWRTQFILPYHHLIKKQYNFTPYCDTGVKRLGVPPMKFCDGPRGVVSQRSTCFPVAMARGATFDPELEHKVGVVVAREIIAAGGNFFGGVCVNLLRHPAWGRSQETYGEDSHLLAKMGVAVTQGVQSLGVMACLKHYALNSMENARFKVDVQCSERTLREVYLPHFKACVDAGAASVMTAYNKVQGTYCGHSKKLVTDILKQEWGFKGFVITDFIWGMYDTVEAATAGIDLEMPWPKFYGRKLVKAVNKGRVDETYIDEAARRIAGTTLRFSEVLKPHSDGDPVAACKEHCELARTVAESSMTLLKNDNQVLPLKKGSIKRLAVLGELSEIQNIGDHGSSKVVPPYIITPLEGLKKYLGSDVIIDYQSGENLVAAEEACSAADAVIFCVGYRHSDEGERIMNSEKSPGGDRDHLGLRPEEVSLLQQCAPQNTNNVVVLFGGSAITLSDWDSEVASILFAYYPGMEGGNALARTLFGDVVPGGKLPFTIVKDAAHLPFFDKNADAIEYGYYHGYTLLDREGVEPAYAFGYGLSYSRFDLSDAHFLIKDDRFEAAVSVTNSGAVTADEVVQFYIGCEDACIDMPKKVLRDFQRVTIPPGESKQVTVSAGIETMRWFDEHSGEWQLETGRYKLYVGNSSRDQDLITGEVVVS